MISKRTFTIIANHIAENLNREYCMKLDKKLMNALKVALEHRHISVKRQNEIVNSFCEVMLGGK